jgi:hypothetical protein
MKMGNALLGVVLPPPAGTILLYAADGLSVRQGDLSPAGRPRTPKRSTWVPLFREHLDTDEGTDTLYSLAEDGMRAWDCSPDQMNGLRRAFEDITFRALSLAALEYFAATAPTPITLKSPIKPPEVQQSKPEPKSASLPKAGSKPFRPKGRTLFHQLAP